MEVCSKCLWFWEYPFNFFSRQNLPVVTFNFDLIFQMDIECLFLFWYFFRWKIYVVEPLPVLRYSKANENANSYNAAVSNALRLVFSKLHRNPVIFSWNLIFALEKWFRKLLCKQTTEVLGTNAAGPQQWCYGAVQYYVRLSINIGGQTK